GPEISLSLSPAMKPSEGNLLCPRVAWFAFLWSILIMADVALSIRFPDRTSQLPNDSPSHHPLKTAVFALGSFWRSEAVFGCLDGVVITTVGYAGGSKTNPEYRSLGDHAESVQIEYDPRLINFRQLLEVFWSSHDSRQVFGQGPDVGNQYRSIIFTNGSEESRLAAKFELKRNPFLLQLIGNLPEEELEKSSLAAKLNSYSAELCPTKIQKQIDAKINDIIRKDRVADNNLLLDIGDESS
ncbi:hypothetical protein C3L33_22038, partial [Rhododendron williamsianum]